jgi:putative ABC transport system permease protein
MTWLRVWVSRILELVLRPRRDDHLAEEVNTHLELLATEYVSRGMSPEEATFAARRAFGGVDQISERHRDERGLPRVDSLLQDVRFAVRLMVTDRWFTAATVGTLALGIGATTTIFTVVNGWHLTELPVDDPTSIVHLGTVDAQGRPRGVSYLDFRDWQNTARSLSGVAAYIGSNMSLVVAEHAAEHVAGTYISATGFSVLRERPILGRDFRPEDDQPGAEAVVMLAHHVWTERFAADRSVIGRTIRVDGAQATIIGVMRAGFRFPVLTDIWLPLANMPGVFSQARDRRTIGVFGRLADDVTLPQARAELSTVTAGLATQFPNTNQNIQPRVVKFTERYFGTLSDGPPFMMMVAVGFVLLIACLNAANLLLARGAVRGREMLLRAVLGASRGRLVQQLLIESLLLAALAGALGLVLAWPLVRVIAAETADFNLPYWARLTFDARVFAFVATICVGTALLFGFAPAWKLSHTCTAPMLEDRSRSITGGVESRRWTSGLLVAELALTVILLVCAGLLIRSAAALSNADRLIHASEVVIARLSLPTTTYATPQVRMALYDALEQRLVSMPAVVSAALSSAPPFFGASGTRHIVLDSDVEGMLSTGRSTLTLPIGSRYFETLGLRLRKGREFGPGDGRPGQQTAIVNERFATLYFPSEEPIGRRIRLVDPSASAPPTWLTIAGVSPAIRHAASRDVGPVVYLPLRLSPDPNVTLMVRPRGDSTPVLAELREHVRMLDPDLPLFNVSTLERLSEQSRWIHRFGGSMLGLLGGIAVLLSALGLYAVTAYGVVQRTSEIGIRMALGAQRSQVVWLFLKGTLTRIGLGLTIGVLGAIGVGHLLRGLLVQTSAVDPVTFAIVVVLATTVALAASVVPTRHASALDPAVTLRHD